MISMLLVKSQNNVIGRNNSLPWHIPEDLRYFRKLTMGKSVVMGRRTFQAIGRALPGRENYVLTHDDSFHAKNVHVIHDIKDILAISGDVVIIGGASLVQQTLDLVDVLYLTELHTEVDGDTFVDIDLSQWKLQQSVPGNRTKDIPFEYDFNVYVRK